MAELKTKLIEFDGNSIELTRKKVKNINIRISPGATVLVSAPRCVSEAEIIRVLMNKRQWINSAVERAKEKKEREDAKKVISDETILFGKTLPLVIVRGAKKRAVEFNGGTLNIYIKSSDDASEIIKLCDTYRAEQLTALAHKYVSLWEKKIGVRVSAVKIRRMTSRYGSMNTRSGEMHLAAELSERDEQLIEYVIVHEMCHLLEPSHNRRFHELVSGYLPKEKALDRALKRKQ